MEFWQIILTAVLCNALIGIIAIEIIMLPMRKFIKGNEDLDSKYPAFRRKDTKYWTRCRLYSVAVTLLPIRGILFIIMALTVTLTLNCIGCGLGVKTSRRNCRMRISRCLMAFVGKMTVFLAGLVP